MNVPGTYATCFYFLNRLLCIPQMGPYLHLRRDAISMFEVGGMDLGPCSVIFAGTHICFQYPYVKPDLHRVLVKASMRHVKTTVSIGVNFVWNNVELVRGKSLSNYLWYSTVEMFYHPKKKACWANFPMFATVMRSTRTSRTLLDRQHRSVLENNGRYVCM